MTYTEQRSTARKHNRLALMLDTQVDTELTDFKDPTNPNDGELDGELAHLDP